MTSPQPAQLAPKIVNIVRIVMFVQAALGLVAGAFVLLLLLTAGNNSADGTNAVIGVFTVLSIVAAVVLLVCAVKLPSRLPWVRVTTIVIEAITAVDGVITLVFALNPLAVLRVVCGVLVIQALLRRDVRAWFAEAETRLP
ncbi:hypothetical protein MOQ72_10740 [Saccharopolyspora sp. K220]|uniref:hypothetical protein n=1 Tax=Saccharopolyspora soli TaxID=2926618 RepID=UPI001F59D8C3|nr:hypothetical protein [Saccharopolyspora soli]MCI2417901.1 hypothetical protein [Saccharopolyspora soli]